VWSPLYKITTDEIMITLLVITHTIAPSCHRVCAEQFMKLIIIKFTAKSDVNSGIE